MKKNRQFFHSFKEVSTSYAHAYMGAHTYDPRFRVHTLHTLHKNAYSPIYQRISGQKRLHTTLKNGHFLCATFFFVQNVCKMCRILCIKNAFCARINSHIYSTLHTAEGICVQMCARFFSRVRARACVQKEQKRAPWPAIGQRALPSPSAGRGTGNHPGCQAWISPLSSVMVRRACALRMFR